MPTRFRRHALAAAVLLSLLPVADIAARPGAQADPAVTLSTNPG